MDWNLQDRDPGRTGGDESSVNVPPISIPTLMPCAIESRPPVPQCTRTVASTNHFPDPVLLLGCGNENNGGCSMRLQAVKSHITSLTVRRMTSNIEVGKDPCGRFLAANTEPHGPALDCPHLFATYWP